MKKTCRNFIFLVSFFFIFFLSCYKHKILYPIITQPSIDNVKTISIVGIWQKHDYVMAAGWFDNFQFFPTGKYIFNYNTMDDSKRIIYFSGNYEINNNKLKLSTNEIKKIIGGELSKTPGINGFYIKNGKETIEKISPPTVKVYDISDISIYTISCEEGILEFPLVIIDSEKYYKLENDPNRY